MKYEIKLILQSHIFEIPIYLYHDIDKWFKAHYFLFALICIRVALINRGRLYYELGTVNSYGVQYTVVSLCSLHSNLIIWVYSWDAWVEISQQNCHCHTASVTAQNSKRVCCARSLWSTRALSTMIKQIIYQHFF